MACAILATFDAPTTVGIRRADDVLAGHLAHVGVPGTPDGWTSPDRDAASGVGDSDSEQARRPRRVTDSHR